MFEYMDPIFILALTMLPIAFIALFAKERRYNITHNTDKIAVRVLSLLSLITIVSMAFYSSHTTKEKIHTNTQAFKNGALLKCSSGEQNFLVFSKNGWKISKESFYSQSNILRIRDCSVLEKKDFQEE